MSAERKIAVEKKVEERPIEWMGSTLENVRAFPKAVRREVGYALDVAQHGGKAINVFPLTGFGGASVVEVVCNHDGNAYRAIYTVRFKKAVYVLHAFMKKSKRGSETPRHEMELIQKRLKTAQEHYEANY